jgi:hypothetical protein
LKARGLALDPNQPRGIAAFLVDVARRHPPVMCAMLSKLMPTQVETSHDVQQRVYHTWEEVAERLRELGIEPRRIYPLHPLLEQEKKPKPN